MKLKKSFFSITLVFILSISGMSLAQAGNSQIQTCADEITEGILQGMNQNSYEQFSANFDQAMKQSLTEEQFRATKTAINSKIGDYVSKEYLSSETRDNYLVVVFKAAFTGEPGDVIVKTVLKEVDGQIYVSGFWLDSPLLRM